MLQQEEIRKEIMKNLGIENLPPATQEEIMAIATGSILKSMSAAILSRMPEEAQKEFTDAFVGGNPKRVEELLDTHIPDADLFVASELQKATEEFRKLYAGAK